MRRTSIKAVLLCLAAVAVLALAAVPVQAKRNLNPRVIPPQARPFGLSYGDWGARYCQWLIAIPPASNPANDTTGVNAGTGQSGKVWFLAPAGVWTEEWDGGARAVVERTITVPVGRAVFVPLWSVDAEVAMGNGTNEAELRALADFFAAHVSKLGATLDGRIIRDLRAYRGASHLFKLWWPDDNNFGYDPITEPTDAIVDGYWLMLAPLSVGQHELWWTSECTWTKEEVGFDYVSIQDTTYHITATPR